MAGEGLNLHTAGEKQASDVLAGIAESPGNDVDFSWFEVSLAILAANPPVPY